MKKIFKNNITVINNSILHVELFFFNVKLFFLLINHLLFLIKNWFFSKMYYEVFMFYWVICYIVFFESRNKIDHFCSHCCHVTHEPSFKRHVIPIRQQGWSNEGIEGKLHKELWNPYLADPTALPNTDIILFWWHVELHCTLMGKTPSFHDRR